MQEQASRLQQDLRARSAELADAQAQLDRAAHSNGEISAKVQALHDEVRSQDACGSLACMFSNQCLPDMPASFVQASRRLSS